MHDDTTMTPDSYPSDGEAQSVSYAGLKKLFLDPSRSVCVIINPLAATRRQLVQRS